MASLIGFNFEFALTRAATVWPLIGRDSYGGYEFGAPYYTGEKKIWFKLTHELFKNQSQQENISTAKIITKFTVAKDWKEGDYILVDEDATANPDPISAGAHEIGKVEAIASDPIGSEDAYIVMVK